MSFTEGTPTTVITLDKERTLGFTIGSARRIKELRGTLELEADEEGAILSLPIVVWACLPAEDRQELSVEDIEDMIHPLNMRAISDAVAALFQASQPEGAEGNALPVPPKVRRAANR